MRGGGQAGFPRFRRPGDESKLSPAFPTGGSFFSHLMLCQIPALGRIPIKLGLQSVPSLGASTPDFRHFPDQGMITHHPLPSSSDFFFRSKVICDRVPHFSDIYHVQMAPFCQYPTNLAYISKYPNLAYIANQRKYIILQARLGWSVLLARLFAWLKISFLCPRHFQLPTPPVFQASHVPKGKLHCSTLIMDARCATGQHANFSEVPL